MKLFEALHQEGLQETAKKVRTHILNQKAVQKKENYKDFLFICSSNEDDKQREKSIFKDHIRRLELFNYSTELIEEDKITIASVRCFKVFVFGRCQDNQELSNLVCLIKQLNKRVILIEELPDIMNGDYEEVYSEKSLSVMEESRNLIQYYKSVLPQNVGLFLPGLAISGGIRVVLKHACILQKTGKDVTLFVLDSSKNWYSFEDCNFPVISLKTSNICGVIDHAVATMWTTLSIVEKCDLAKRKSYLVQNFETDFYSEENRFYVEANRTYSPHTNIEFFTISKWCQNWLFHIFGQQCTYIRNGIELKQFHEREREFSGRVRILIEGDSEAEHKNIDEAFKIVDKLEPEKYEIWYMSYNGQPKPQYRVDVFLHKIPYEGVSEVYEQCHILLKTSLLESFSYPPLEMMATGGYVVAVPNGGNAEYLMDEYNCLLYPSGDLDRAKEQIERICQDCNIRKLLLENGKRTVEKRDWHNIETEILTFYN